MVLIPRVDAELASLASRLYRAMLVQAVAVLVALVGIADILAGVHLVHQ